MIHKQIKDDNGTTHYYINELKSKIAIIFTHGVTADHTMFDKQIEYFENRYTIITWDVPGHGLSKGYKNFSYKNCAEILYKILGKEGISKVVLVGMSMGGYPSQEFIADYPEMVEKFIAIDTTPFGTKYYSKSDIFWLKRVKKLGSYYPVKILRESMAKSISATKYSYEVMKKILENSSKEEILEQMDIAYRKFIEENRDIEIKCPVLLLLGDRDSTGKVKKYNGEWAKNTRYPLHIIKNAKHFSNGDNPEEVNLEIEKFITN